MRYQNIVQAEFINRPNRFIAQVKLDGKPETVHVKNTGRCRELLTHGARVYLEESGNRERKTKYDLVAVEKGSRLINMDSQAPNKVVEEWLKTGALFSDLVLVRPETKYGNSRFDFYIETQREKIFMEVKGVTLEENGIVRFPDAPSERAVKHVEELIKAKGEGYRAFVLFVIQMSDVQYFTPNRDTQPAFAEVLARAADQGVELLAYDCITTPEELVMGKPVPVVLQKPEKLSQGGFGKNLTDIKGTFRLGNLSEIPFPLLKWYDNNKRILPWREDPTPYRVWVSEIMLQQTRVEAVKPFFERFMSSLPDIPSLAAADSEALLKLWEGLGYYNRVRNLQAAAVQIVEGHNGRMPDDYGELLKLKGIGSYTAGAVASIAYGKPVPAVDGNVLRVVSRVRMDGTLITEAKVKARVERDLQEIIPRERPGDFNQAMMEIGACICLPNGAPKCGECPLAGICMAHTMGKEMEFPKKAVKKHRKVEEKTVLVIRDQERAALRKRPDKGLLAGMYELPSMEGFRTAEEVTQYLAAAGLKAIRIQPLEDAKHIFTHREWHMRGYMVRVDELEMKAPLGEARDWLFIEPQETQERFPVPAAFAAYVKYLNIRLGNEKYGE